MIFEVFRENLCANVQRPPGARRRRAAGAQTPPLLQTIKASPATGNSTLTHFLDTRRGAELAPSTPPRSQPDIATRSGHPSNGTDSILGALRARQSPPEVGGLKRTKKRLFLHVSRPVHPRAAPEDQRTACCDRGTSFGPTRPPCTERGRVDSSYVKRTYPPPSCTTWEAPNGVHGGTPIPISPK